jgi:hypothetical protein
MLTSEQAEQLARNVVARRFAEAHVAFCAGSLMRGEGTRYSDIDLVVIFPSLKQARREAFIYDNVPVEAFLHDPATLRYFFEHVDAASGIASLPRMVSEGAIVWGEASEARLYKQWAAEILARGPVPLTPEQIRNTAYVITDMVDDLRAPRSKAELVGTGANLYQVMGDFALRSKCRWSGKGKHIIRRLDNEDPDFCREFIDAFEDMFATGKATKVVLLAESLLAPHGGFVFDGFAGEAPVDWRKD